MRAERALHTSVLEKLADEAGIPRRSSRCLRFAGVTGVAAFASASACRCVTTDQTCSNSRHTLLLDPRLVLCLVVVVTLQSHPSTRPFDGTPAQRVEKINSHTRRGPPSEEMIRCVLKHFDRIQRVPLSWRSSIPPTATDLYLLAGARNDKRRRERRLATTVRWCGRRCSSCAASASCCSSATSSRYEATPRTPRRSGWGDRWALCAASAAAAAPRHASWCNLVCPLNIRDFLARNKVSRRFDWENQWGVASLKK